jgi:cytoskeletal protein CcmA (bactofilin family)
MALWSNKDKQENPGLPAPAGATDKKVHRQGSGSVLGPGLRWNGRISGGEDLRLEGQFVGELNLSSGQVTVASGAEVEANIAAKTVVVEGKVSGEVRGKETVVVRRGAAVEGNISAPRVILEDGCRVTGAIDMAGHASSPTKASSGSATATGGKAAVGAAGS